VLDAYVVIPDGESAPAAAFTNLGAAISWALLRYGSDAFRIRTGWVSWADLAAPAPSADAA
jgi:hypothetical protein